MFQRPKDCILPDASFTKRYCIEDLVKYAASIDIVFATS